jgi:dCMP deaminase
MSLATLSQNRWDRRFFEMCHLIGSWSEDKSRQIGCVIVGNANEVRAVGFNGLPRGVNGDVDTRHSREEGEKYHWFEHAERNAIYNAARIGVAVSGCRMYVTLYPCAECARAIIQTGITSVHTFAPPASDTFFSRSFEIAKTMLSEGGVEVIIHENDLVSPPPPAVETQADDRAVGTSTRDRALDPAWGQSSRPGGAR